MANRRVVVTGVGMVTALGNSAAETWAAMQAGRSGVGPLTKCELPGIAPEIAIAGEVKNFAPEPVLDRKDARRMDWFIQYAMVAAHEALEHAGLGGLGPVPEPEETGTIIGSGMGGLISIMETADASREKGLGRVSPFFIPASIINLASGQVAIRTGAQGPSYAPVSACASSNHAIGEAFHAIQRGDAKMMIAGGTEACLTPISFGGFAAARALATQYDSPETASRPFDSKRSGFVHGEGGGILVLEELESARARGAPILAEVLGFGMSADAFHITAPPENGEGAALAMKRALRSAGIAPEAVTYINAHGTSTPVGDTAETRAIRSVFGAHADRVPVSSIKSMIGHALGGSASIEAGISVFAIRDGVIPPTINLTDPDPECDLDYVPNTARKAELDVVLSNSFGFGGANTTLVLRRFNN
ncbi:MAG TPA: beta-ketoacyl-ACP synthase II [Longimicrobium sp.]|nr:beta-ketoacyl-ACP synthase II [Longimicrobium sp.]